jgi:Lysophospholipase L1 and related esterases
MKGQPVVMLGDSLTEGGDWRRAFSRAEVRNLGIGGDTWAGVWGRLEEVVRLKPAQIFLMIGINDLLRGALPEEIVAGHVCIWEELAAKLPTAALRVESLLPYLEAALPGLPSNLDIIWINERLAEEAGKRSLEFIDLFSLMADPDRQLALDYTSDGLHLTPAAYQVWADRIRPLIESA